MQYTVQVLGVRELQILDIVSEEPILVSEGETVGEIQLIIGGKFITLYLGNYCLVESSGSVWCPTIIKHKSDS